MGAPPKSFILVGDFHENHPAIGDSSICGPPVSPTQGPTGLGTSSLRNSPPCSCAWVERWGDAEGLEIEDQQPSKWSWTPCLFSRVFSPDSAWRSGWLIHGVCRESWSCLAADVARFGKLGGHNDTFNGFISWSSWQPSGRTFLKTFALLQVPDGVQGGAPQLAKLVFNSNI